ncbi:SIS domain-containing protein [Thalassobaculum sp. OXR-137]|uniref:SIS domain-containing protein n=1 Tax=Thalassobaculum sp. OXR-137 TaxID=3100173 RepID=UPI002AC9534B|nr:SIS domain-containing protein [Thalassobaculum sp. OXR-137]WPZ35249.1 SIS domain-containing protein [Thalassobaculum sp. OXR-137]
MIAKSLLEKDFEEHFRVASETRAAVESDFERLVDACAASVSFGGKILFFGNGGSAADAQHLSTELVVRYVSDRAAIAALALTTDTSALTAGANDLGFDRVFSRQIEALGRPGDIAIGLSTSGKSPNVLRGLEAAKAQGLTAVAMVGANREQVAPIADIVISVPARAANRIQEMHILIGHALCGSLERRLGLVEEQ